MNTSKLIAAAGISLTAALFTTTASATVLTFDQVGITNGITVDQDYGDRVTGASDLSGSYGTAGGATGNVVVEYLNLGPNVSLLWTGGYNDLDNVLYVEPDGTADPMAIRFTADAGYNVVLGCRMVTRPYSPSTISRLPALAVAHRSSRQTSKVRN